LNVDRFTQFYRVSTAEHLRQVEPAAQFIIKSPFSGAQMSGRLEAYRLRAKNRKLITGVAPTT